MKLLYIQDHLGLGGISKVESTKENWLVKYDYKVTNLFTHYEDVPKIQKWYDSSINTIGISLELRQKTSAVPIIGRLLWYVYFRIAFIFHIYRINPDVIISTHPNLEPVTVILFTFWKKRFLEHHISGVLNGKGLRIWIIRNIKIHFYTQVCLTNGDAADKEAYYHQQAIVMPNPCRDMNIEPSTCLNKKIIIPARFNAQKGIKPFLPYWKEIEEKHSDWELHLFGDGEEKDNILQIISDCKYESVYVHPFSNQIFDEIADSSILLLPSMYEGFPTTLIEAMMCGVPCVAFNCHYGPSDIIRDGEDGYVVELKKYDQFIERIDNLICNDEIRQEMGRKARVNIQRYNIDSIMAQWIKLFGK